MPISHYLIICGCFHVTRAELIVETETLRPTEPKMYSLPSSRRVCDSWL